MKQSIAENRVQWWHLLVLPFLLCSITFFIYLPSLNYDFQFDDIFNILKHFNIRHGSLQKLFFSGPRWISYWLNSLYYQMAKFDPFFYRCGNICIHLLNGFLIFYLFYFILSRTKQKFLNQYALLISTLTSGLFLLHPVQTQTVSYVIQGQLEGLSALFLLSMCLTFLHFAYAKNIIVKSLLAILFCGFAVLSCGTKEIAIISPALLLLIDWFAIAKGSWHSLKRRLWFHALVLGWTIGAFLYLLKPAFFLNIFGFKITLSNNFGNIITANPQDKITPYFFCISQFKVLLHYIWIFLFPFFISAEYDWKICESFFSADCLLPFLGVMLLLVIIFLWLKKNRSALLLFGPLWFLVCMAPRASIVPSPELVADYKTYLASLGIFFVISVGIAWVITYLLQIISFFKKSSYKIIFQYAFLFLFFIPISLLTVQRNQVWSSGLEFWGNIIKNAPGKARAYNNYGVELSQKQHRFEEAIAYFKKALLIDPVYPDAYNNMAVSYSQLEKIDLAINALQHSLKINPNYTEGYNNIASFFLQKNDHVNAEKALRYALKLRPHYGKAWYNLGRVHLARNEQDKAFECFKTCCTKADLDNQFGYAAYAKSAIQEKRYQDAIEAFSKIIQLQPDNIEAQFNLANSYQLNNQFNKAITLYEQLVQQNPENFRMWYNLGEAYLKTHQAVKALACFNKIENNKHQMPNWYIRVAACYEQLGNISKAQQLLTELLNAPFPQHIKDATRSVLAQMQRRYGITKT